MTIKSAGDIVTKDIAMREEFAVDRDKIVRPPIHPGLFFERNIMPELRRQGRTSGEIATLLGVARQTLHRVKTGEHPVTPDMAVRLGKLCGNGPDSWLNKQARYDAWEASQRLASELKKSPTLRE
jgi:addiction module HigA family antidote